MPFRRLCSSLARSTLIPPSLLKPLTIPNPNLSPSLRFSRPNHTYSPPKAQMSAARRHPSVPIPALEKADRPELLRALETTLNCTFTTRPIAPPRRPLIVVISGPSGVGKDAVIKRLQEMRGDVHFVVTTTTREMRPGEVEGKDYYFVKKDEFLSMIERNELLEYALVYGDYKGIPKRQIREFMAKGCDIVLRVDVQGAATLKRILGDSAVFIFLVAENELELVNRLVERKTETKETLQVRIATAREEVKCIREFDYVVVNAEGKLENATRMVEAIIDSEKARVRQRTASI